MELASTKMQDIIAFDVLTDYVLIAFTDCYGWFRIRII